MSQRKEKVAQRIKEEISDIIHNEIKDPRIGFLTITRVELTPDLRFGKVYYSIMGTDQQKKDAELGLESAYKFIRRILGERLTIRYTPDISFRVDDSCEYNLHIAGIFDKIDQERLKKKGADND
ncbi:MAG: 30S ribosome-binding factor RbfA [Candidatus Omnitrophica bacterium]|nr:30S ribosome-binding factor RbfA [Candidatus Omnitrophota bacterium]